MRSWSTVPLCQLSQSAVRAVHGSTFADFDFLRRRFFVWAIRRRESGRLESSERANLV